MQYHGSWPVKCLPCCASATLVLMNLIGAAPLAGASTVAISCTVRAIYDVQAQDTKDTSQVGVYGLINSQASSIYPGKTLPGPRRSVGLLNDATGGYVLFGWVRDSVTVGRAVTYMEFRTASGGVGSTLGTLLGNKTLKDNTWHGFKISYAGHGVWKEYLDGSNRALYSTPNLGFSGGHPFLRALRTNCDSGGNAHFENLKHFNTASSERLWSKNTCRLDTDPGKHLKIISAHEDEVPSGQNANGCAGTTT